jgi:beta-N-acetylhexosaminidase
VSASATRPSPPSSADPPSRPPGRGARDPRRRRRTALVALGIAAGLATLAGAAVGGAGPDSRRAPPRAAKPPARPADRLTLEQRVGQTLMLSFRNPEAPDYVLDLLRKRRAAGVVLFGENVSSRDQLRELTRDLQRAAGGRALIAADQEGGSIRQVPWAGPAEGQAVQATDAEAADAAREAARDLRAVGVNVNLAPIADVGAPEGSAIGGRAYPGDSRQVAALTRAAVRAYRGEGVAPTPKHLPGFGAAEANTDDEPVDIDLPRRDIVERELEPFRAAVAAGTPLVMASHARYTALDRKRIASQSPAVLEGLLRRELGFRGVVVTDSIEAEAVLRRSSVATAGARSIGAGADIVLMTGPGSYSAVYERVLAQARRSPRFRERVRRSADRVLALAATTRSRVEREGR